MPHPLSYLQPAGPVVQTPPPTLSPLTRSHPSRLGTTFSWELPLPSSAPRGSCAWATSTGAAISLGYECRFFVWFSLYPEDKVQAVFTFEFPAPGTELAHFGFSKCLLSKGMKSWTSENKVHEGRLKLRHWAPDDQSVQGDKVGYRAGSSEPGVGEARLL